MTAAIGGAVKARGTARPPAPGSPAACRRSASRSSASTAARAAANERSIRVGEIGDQAFVDRELAVGEQLDEDRAQQRVVGRASAPPPEARAAARRDRAIAIRQVAGALRAVIRT